MRQSLVIGMDRLFNALLVALYAGVVGVMLLFHEPWRDEAQSWLIVRDLDLAGIFGVMGYEGTPALWHLLQMPLVKLGLPYASLGVLNVVVATAGVAVLCFYSPFSRWQKVAAVFSFYVMYEYGVVARCYSLIVLAMFLTAAAYGARKKGPVVYAAVLCVLANINVQSLGVAMLLGGFYAIECWLDRGGEGLRKRWVGLAVIALGMVGAVVQLRPPADTIYHGMFRLHDYKEPLQMTRDAFVADQEPWGLPVYAVGFAVFLVVLWDLRRQWVSFWLAALTYAGWCYVFTFKTAACPRHNGLLMVVLIAAMWIGRSHGRELGLVVRYRGGKGFRWMDRMGIAEAVVFGSMALSTVYCGSRLIQEVQEPFSGAKEAAGYIRAHPIDAPIVTFRSMTGAALLPYLPGRRFWGLEAREYGTFTVWTKKRDENRSLAEEEIVRRAKEDFSGEKAWLLLDRALSDPRRYGYKLVFQNSRKPSGHGSDEYFRLYEPIEGR